MGTYIGINPREIEVGTQVYLIDSAKATFHVAECLTHEYLRNGRYVRSKYRTTDRKVIVYRPGAQYRIFTDLDEATKYLSVRAKKRKEYLESELEKMTTLIHNTSKYIR